MGQIVSVQVRNSWLTVGEGKASRNRTPMTIKWVMDRVNDHGEGKQNGVTGFGTGGGKLENLAGDQIL